MNKQELIKEFREVGIYSLNILGTEIKAIPTEIAITSIEQLDESQKIVVPQFVADWLSNLKSGLFGLNYDSVSSEIYDWVYATEDNLRKLHLAFVYGYEVEKEKRYLVKVKGIVNALSFLSYHKNADIWTVTDKNNSDGHRAHHTRKELEEAGFGWVFDCPGIEIEEVE